MFHKELRQLDDFAREKLQNRAMKTSTVGRTMSMAVFLLAVSFCLLRASDPARALKFQQAVDLFESKGDVKGALRLFEDVVKSTDRNLAARSLLYIGTCYEALGQEGARKAYEQLVRDFGDQADVTAKARGRLAAIGKKPGAAALTSERISPQVWGGRHYWAVSPDGRYALFSVGFNRNALSLADLTSWETRKVVSLAGRDLSVAISPDSKKIAYADGEPGAKYAVGIADADGSNILALAANSGGAVHILDWSADGKQILATISAADAKTEKRAVFSPDGSYRLLGDTEPLPLARTCLSPDGRYILRYELPSKRSYSPVFVASVADGTEVPLADVKMNSPRWSADGRRVLFLSSRMGTDDLWSVGVVDGKPDGAPQLVKGNLGDKTEPMGITRSGDYYYVAQMAARDLYVVDVDPKTGKSAGRPRRINDGGRNVAPAWSPDGESLIYYNQNGPTNWVAGGMRIVVRSMKSGEERLVTPKVPLILGFTMAQWFPDGRSVFIYPSSRKLIQLDTQTGDVRMLLNGADLVLEPTFQQYVSGPNLAPNGRFLVYRRKTATGPRLVRRDLPDGEEKEICRYTATVFSTPSISPDSSRVAFWADAKVMTVSAQGGKPVEVKVSQESGKFGGEWKPVQQARRINAALRWSPDGARLYFVTQPNAGVEGSDEIWTVPVAGGRPEPLGIGLHSIWDMDLARDGKHLVFYDEQSHRDLWRLKNLFPTARASQ